MRAEIREAAFEQLREKHGEIYVLVSPPRCCSTAFARVLWEHRSIRYYSHEPFEVTYYLGHGVSEVVERLRSPLDLGAITRCASPPSNGRLVIKEMPYQVGENFELLLSLATQPVTFLVRDPRLNIASRMAQKRVGGESEIFPLVETGWELLAEQIRFCRENGVPYALVDASDFRSHPRTVFEKVLAGLDLPFTESLLKWDPCEQVALDNLGGRHDHLYLRVLASEGIEPPTEEPPDVHSFPAEGGVRDHVHRCLDIYGVLREDSARVRP